MLLNDGQIKKSGSFVRLGVDVNPEGCVIVFVFTSFFSFFFWTDRPPPQGCMIQHLLWWQLLLLWYLGQQRVRVRVMIGFLVRGRIRIKIKIRVRFGLTNLTLAFTTGAIVAGANMSYIHHKPPAPKPQKSDRPNGKMPMLPNGQSAPAMEATSLQGSLICPKKIANSHMSAIWKQHQRVSVVQHCEVTSRVLMCHEGPLK